MTKGSKEPMSTDKQPTERLTYKQLFQELVKILGFSDRTIPTKERIAKLKIRLSTYKPDELRQAARALAADGRMQGDNEAGKRWGTIDYLIRNDTNVAKYLETDAPTSTEDFAEELNNGKYF